MLDHAEALLADFGRTQAYGDWRLMSHSGSPRSNGLHVPPSLPRGFGAVYIFTLTAEYGRTCRAGPGRALKVGKAKAESSAARFRSQHYGRKRAPSTLAGRLVDWTEWWDELGIDFIDDAGAETWLLRNTDRDHYLVPVGAEGLLLAPFESFLHERLRPIFEGGRPGRWSPPLG